MPETSGCKDCGGRRDTTATRCRLCRRAAAATSKVWREEHARIEAARAEHLAALARLAEEMAATMSEVRALMAELRTKLGKRPT